MDQARRGVETEHSLGYVTERQRSIAPVQEEKNISEVRLAFEGVGRGALRFFFGQAKKNIRKESSDACAMGQRTVARHGGRDGDGSLQVYHRGLQYSSECFAAAVPCFDFGGQPLWGATAMILNEFLTWWQDAPPRP